MTYYWSGAIPLVLECPIQPDHFPDLVVPALSYVFLYLLNELPNWSVSGHISMGKGVHRSNDHRPYNLHKNYSVLYSGANLLVGPRTQPNFCGNKYTINAI